MSIGIIKNELSCFNRSFSKRHIIVNIVLSLYFILGALTELLLCVFSLGALSNSVIELWVIVVIAISNSVSCMYIVNSYNVLVHNYKESLIKSWILLGVAVFPVETMCEVYFLPEYMFNCVVHTIILTLFLVLFCFIIMRLKKYGASAWTMLDIPRSKSRKRINVKRIILLLISSFVLAYIYLGCKSLSKWISTTSSTSSESVFRSSDTAQIGDYYYSDGSVSSELQTSKECIGLVYSISTDAIEHYSDYTHGRIVAFEDASVYKQAWQDNPYDIDDFPNYTWNNRMSIFTDYGGYGYIYDEAYPQLYINDLCKKFRKYGSGISDWYVPTAGQWAEILENIGQVKIDNLLKFDGEKASENLQIINIDPKRWYWTITEQDENNAWSIRLASGEFGSRTPKINKAYIRPVASF